MSTRSSMGTTGLTRRIGAWGSPTVRRGAADLSVLVLLLGLGVVAHGPVFGGTPGHVVAGVGVLVGLLVAALGAWGRWSWLGTLLATMVAYLLVGGPVVLPSTTIGGVVPTLETLQRLTLLSWQGWRDLLTVALPADQFEGPAVVPLLTGLVTAVLAATAVLRLRRLAWVVAGALLPALALLVVGILWGTHSAPMATAQGAAFAVVALAWVAWRSRIGTVTTHAIFDRPTSGRGRSSRSRSAMGSALVLGAFGLLGAALVPVVAPHPDRHVLRDDVVPPLDLSTLASPLTLFRELSANLEEETLFTVTGLPDGARIRLAAMDVYDGNVYRVTEESAAFRNTAGTILPGEFSDPDAALSSLHFEIDAYEGVWLPGGGDLRHVDFTAGLGNGPGVGLHHNAATGTALVTAGLRRGTAYDVEVALVPTYSAEARQQLSSSAVPDPEWQLPRSPVRVDAIGNALPGFIEGAATPMEQLRAIEKSLTTDGFFANGTDEAHPSYPGHTIARITQLLDGRGGQMVGDDEQYAVAFALMARALDLPARVVMGFYPPAGGDSDGTVTITGGDTHVWVEVAFEDLGWVQFDPTPPEDQKPEVTTPKPNPRNEPQMLPPPEVPEEREPTQPPQADSDVDQERETNVLSGTVKYVLVGIGGLLLLLGPFLLVVLLKSRRRKRRRNAPRVADRISGGWAEVIDLAKDLGIAVPTQVTRTEAALLMGDRIPTTSGTPMAGRVDAHVFGPGEPTSADADSVWGAVDGVRDEFRRSVGLGTRLRARFSTRSLRRRTHGRRGRHGA